MHISTMYYRPRLVDGIKTGQFTYAGQKPVNNVIDQLKTLLGTIRDESGNSAADICEWIHPDNADLKKFPEGEPIAAMSYGSNEGYLVRIMVLNRTRGEIRNVITIKYFATKDFVYSVAKLINEALYEGMFVCDEPDMPGACANH